MFPKNRNCKYLLTINLSQPFFPCNEFVPSKSQYVSNGTLHSQLAYFLQSPTYFFSESLIPSIISTDLCFIKKANSETTSLEICLRGVSLTRFSDSLLSSYTLTFFGNSSSNIISSPSFANKSQLSSVLPPDRLHRRLIFKSQLYSFPRSPTTMEYGTKDASSIPLDLHIDVLLYHHLRTTVKCSYVEYI